MEWIRAFTADHGGDRAEFDDLVRRHHRQAYNIAYRMAGNAADAEDLTQEAFLRAYRFFHHYNRNLPFENWLYRIISNVFIDEVRRKPKFRSQSLDQPLAGTSGDSAIRMEIADETADPERVLLHTELDEPLQRALNTLPVEFRHAVILADIEGMSYEEIAEAMSCSLGTVRSRLHRGRKLLRNRIKGALQVTVRGDGSEL